MQDTSEVAGRRRIWLSDSMELVDATPFSFSVYHVPVVPCFPDNGQYDYTIFMTTNVLIMCIGWYPSLSVPYYTASSTLIPSNVFGFFPQFLGNILLY